MDETKNYSSRESQDDSMFGRFERNIERARIEGEAYWAYLQQEAAKKYANK